MVANTIKGPNQDPSSNTILLSTNIAHVLFTLSVFVGA